MKTSDILLLGALVLGGYYLYTKKAAPSTAPAGGTNGGTNYSQLGTTLLNDVGSWFGGRNGGSSTSPSSGGIAGGDSGSGIDLSTFGLA